MSLAIHLLGRPAIVSEADEGYRFRSRKSWALLAYLLLSEHPASRSHLASLLFSEADDPLRALRWNLSEVRRALGPEATCEGDPVALDLPTGTVVDVRIVTRGRWQEAVLMPGLGQALLDRLDVRGASGFDTWLLSEQHRLAAASEAILHEAAVSCLARDLLGEGIAYAARAVAMNPLDENHQALLIRLYRQAGDDAAAEQQFAAYRDLVFEELGVAPGPSVEIALGHRPPPPASATEGASLSAIIESGVAAVGAGAVEAGVNSLRTAVRLADAGGAPEARISARQALGETLIHSLRGQDEEGIGMLVGADELAHATGDRRAIAEARAELGYVDFLRARYDRSTMWLTDALAHADGSSWIAAKALTYLGSVESDRADYPRALALLDDALVQCRAAGDVRREAYTYSMSGRVHLLRGDLDEASDHLDRSIALCEADHWLAFLPWPQALRGEVAVRRADAPAAAALLAQAFARACQLGDPCWEGTAGRALALAADELGEVDRAFDLLADARTRCNRVSDPYVWLDASILDAQCELGLRHGHPDTARWIDEMTGLASRTAMREMIVRSLLHAAALGVPDAADGALLLAEDIDNPALRLRLSGVRGLE